MMEYKSRLQSDDMDYFFKAILSLQNIEECYRFFEDVATINEIKALAQRMHVAKMLEEKKTYTDIVEITHASTATISRVNKCLNYGSEGYNIVLDRLKEDNEDNEK
nr:YerC/YecD family TrpR-related protein [Clostridium sp. TW13]